MRLEVDKFWFLVPYEPPPNTKAHLQDPTFADPGGTGGRTGESLPSSSFHSESEFWTLLRPLTVLH